MAECQSTSNLISVAVAELFFRVADFKGADYFAHRAATGELVYRNRYDSSDTEYRVLHFEDLEYVELVGDQTVEYENYRVANGKTFNKKRAATLGLLGFGMGAAIGLSVDNKYEEKTMTIDYSSDLRLRMITNDNSHQDIGFICPTEPVRLDSKRFSRIEREIEKLLNHFESQLKLSILSNK